jgi:general secretion pathway protein B
MSFSAHMFASVAEERWFNLNGIRMSEGGWFNDNFRLEEITAQKIILSYKGYQFSLNALTDW